MRRLSVLALFLFVCGFLPVTVLAESTINCHCFKDRSFDQQNPEKVIPYLLATTQNSFLAVAFKTEKFQLVKALMSGVPSGRLWTAHYLASKYGVTSKSLLFARSEQDSWSAVLTSADLSQDQLDSQVIAALTAKADDARLAAAVVDATLLARLAADSAQLRQIRVAGADNRETILAFFLARRTGQQATAIYQSVQQGTTNWGTLAFVNNMQIGKMEKEFAALLK